MRLAILLSFLFLSTNSFGQAVDNEVHCDTKLQEVVNHIKDKYYTSGRQHQMLSYRRFPTHSADILNLKDSLNIYNKNGDWLSPDDRMIISVLPVFTKDKAFQSYVVFEGNATPKAHYENGRYIILTKRTHKYKEGWHYFVRAVAYRNSVPVLATQVSLNQETSHDINYTHTPTFAHQVQIRDMHIANHRLRYDKGEITHDEFMDLRSQEFNKSYKAHGVGNISSLWLNCQLR